MAAIPYDVAEAFVHGKRASRGAFRSDGDSSIWSYNLCLAFRRNNGTGDSWIEINHPLDGSHNVSATTARHIRALRDVLIRECTAWATDGEAVTASDLIRGTRLVVRR